MGFRTALRKIFTFDSVSPDRFAATLQQSLPTHEDWLTWANYYPITPASAMAVPGVFRANVLLTDLAAQVALHQERRIVEDNAVRWERVLNPYPIVRRPDPDTPTHETISQIVTSLGTEGEVFLELSAHDLGGRPHSFIVTPKDEVDISWSKTGRRRPVYQLRDSSVRLWRDIAHIKYLALPGKLHGVGPIQVYARNLIGSGDVEAWTRTWFETGGAANTTITVPGDLDPDEATEIKTDWITAHGKKLEPAVLFGGAQVSNNEISPDKAQALETRRYGVQMAASMYGLNPYLLAVAMSGANITYQTLPDLFAEAIRIAVYPNFLRKIETVLTELLPHQHRARFDLSEFLRPDEQTRMKIAKIGIETGIHTVDEWRAREGLPPRKDPANAPTPA